ncbi:hypothetical protein DMC47_11430 [Nostoc sp. 3335mG]|nr:hypothetical protein DMC47_11430 [Nostoc sp. 3335mG]
MILQALPPHQAHSVERLIHRRVAGSLRHRFGWSSMPTVFHEPEIPTHRFDKARELALLFLDATLPEGDDPDAIERLLAELNHLIGKTPADGSLLWDRLDRRRRTDLGLHLSRRRYDKLFRLTVRLEAKLARLRAEQAKYRLLLTSRAGLATELTIEQLGGSISTAAFIAYYAARMKLRSEFTISGQQRPFDDLAAALLRLCEEDSSTDWYAIAHIFPRADVLSRLTREQQGALLGRWFAILTELAEHLEQAWHRTDIDLETMIVRRGNDSSTWNLFAGAWNRARDNWIALVETLGMQALFDQMLPGKVMRLMAADAAYWHRETGGDIHPDTKVWRALPKPWDVLRLEAQCDRATIEAVCVREGVDPLASCWSAARPRTRIAKFRPTPELVHGVSVENPYFAAYLRRLGAHSGRPLREDVLRDVEGS